MVVYAVPAVADDTVTVNFPDGVASGDVTSSRAILWTRADVATNIKVEGWRNSSLSGPKAFIAKIKTSAANDYVAKIDVGSLRPNTEYWFRFKKDLSLSDTGHFKTAPTPSTGEDVDFTYSGDADGFKKPDTTPAFNNFETLDAAKAENGDFWVFDGDTIYSDSSFRPGGPATTLQDYRDAHHLNRTYPALKNLMESTSTYTTMDDHEVFNDYDNTADPARYAAGRKAFLESYPVRETGLPHDPSCLGDPLYRKFQWGSDTELFMLDERSCRTPENPAKFACLGDLGPTLPPAVRQTFPFSLFLSPTPPAACIPTINNPSRTMLGAVQKAQFKQDLLNSTAKFKLVVSEDPIQQFHVLPYDRWEGYGAERSELLNYIRNNGIDNVDFLTTDTHATLLNQVSMDKFTDPAPIANELVTGPIATNTFQAEVIAQAGFLGLFGVNQVMNLDNIDCRHLDKNSYASVNVSDSAGTTTVASKDQTGTVIADQNFGTPNCTATWGP